MHKTKFPIIFIVVSAMCLAGCNDKSGDSSNELPAPRKGEYRVINMRHILTGDTALLAMHLDRRIIGVKIFYDGPKKLINVWHDTWHNGKLIKKDAWECRNWEDVSNDGVLEKTFSVGPSSNNAPTNIAVATGNGHHVGDGIKFIGSRNYPNKNHVVNFIQSTSGPREMSDDEDVAICAIVWRRSDSDPPPLFGDIEKRAKTADYALIFKISFSNTPEYPDYYPEKFKHKEQSRPQHR